MGKTAEVLFLARKYNRFLGVYIPTHHEPADTGGWPWMSPEGHLKHVPPELAELLIESKTGILFIDEFSTANYSLQAPLLRLINERYWGDLKLPDSISIIVAGNPPDTSAGTYYLSAAAANRLVHLDYQLNHTEWCANFPSYWGEEPDKPDLNMAGWRLWRARFAGYIHSRPQALHVLPKSEAHRGGAWPSPRSWDLFSQCCAELDPHTEIDLVAEFGTGCIGEAHSQECLIYLRDFDLPDPALSLKNPEKFRLPKRGDQAYAVLSAIVAHTLNTLTADIFLAAWTIMGIAYKQNAGDLVMATAEPLANAYRKNSSLPLPEKELQKITPLLELVFSLKGRKS